MSRFDAWNPEAGFFHSSTKNVWFLNGEQPAECLLPQPADPDLRPAPTKHYDTAESVSLPRPQLNVPLTSTLLARRSWRQFGPGTIPLPTFANLLAFTAGVQQWVTVPGQGRMPLKTSPSGGARHPVEVYVLAWGIEELDKGLYHYAPDVHALEVVQRGLDSSRVPVYLPTGDYWSKACAVILFSAVYDRELWRYGYSRAYRAPFIEAGHLCQTFCVLATDTVSRPSARWRLPTRLSRPTSESTA